MPQETIGISAKLGKRIAAILFSLCFAALPAAGLTLKLGTYINNADPRFQGLQHFANLVKERTEGRVTIEIYLSDTLMPLTHAHDAIVSGLADIGPLAVIDDRMSCYRFLLTVPSPIVWEKHLEFDEKLLQLLKDEFAKAGLLPLMSSNFSYDQEWAFRKPVSDLSNLSGAIVRSIGPAVTHAIEKLGAKPVFIAPVETYQAAERGVVDGASVGVPLYFTAGWYKVFPNFVKTNMWYANVIYAVNRKVFEGLSPTDQQLVTAAARDAERWLSPKYTEWVDTKLAEMTKQGVKITTVSAADRKRMLASVQEGWMSRMNTACGPELGGKLKALFEQYAE